ncbi:sensor histidine kinase [Glaciecola petra]|uniref:histidine kinase n=1 Tax=Glaciecola petra TaxID=3075602 RepID=A0ABU2ZY72_9ALTE|nr:ATP-binding protein [Aestuariibacter sp. P117]MDT0596362.1 ATP-binding protein [Aestuariibacter sp. P117]
MTIKQKLFFTTVLLHITIMVVAFIFRDALGLYLILIEATLILSMVVFYFLINQALKPLEYVDTFSKLLYEKDFTQRFSETKQVEIDALISQFNFMLNKLHKERLAIGEQKGVFQKLMDESPIGVILLDYERQLSEINPACEKLLGISQDRVVGKKLQQLQHTQCKYLTGIDVDTHQLVDAEQGRQLKIAHYEIRDRGFKRSFYMINELTGDIVESQRMAYEKLIRLMSHEVNNTIAITNSLLQSSLHYRSMLTNEASAEFENVINIVVNRSNSLNKFMQGYASVVKLENPIKTSFDLSKMLTDLVTLFYAECETRNIQITLDVAQTQSINADANLIEQALVNIIKNAMEAIQSGGLIRIVLKQDNEHLMLSVEDSGSGINPEIERKLFTPFFSSKEFGQGVGLMLVREILRLHNIKHELRNREDGEGAVFRWWILDSEST